MNNTKVYSLIFLLFTTSVLSSTTEQQIITTPFNDDDIEFGKSLSVDGNIAVIGAPFDDERHGNSGDAYVYELIDNQWTYITNLKPDDAFEWGQFGKAVDISDNKIIVGSYTRYGIEANRGRIYIFHLIDGDWQQVAMFNSDYDFDRFGSSVSIDNNHALAGAYATEGGGAVYVYKLENNIWSSKGIVKPLDSDINDSFGASIDLRDNKFAVGAPGAQINGFNNGAVYIFDLYDNLWLQSQKLYYDVGQNRVFGGAVSLGENEVLIGAYRGSGLKNGTGAAYFYEYINNSWVLNSKVFDSEGDILYRFGNSVALDGTNALIASAWDNTNGSKSGSVYLYSKKNNLWLQKNKFTASNGQWLDQFGYIVSLSDNNALIGSDTIINYAYSFNTDVIFHSSF